MCHYTARASRCRSWKHISIPRHFWMCRFGNLFTRFHETQPHMFNPVQVLGRRMKNSTVTQHNLTRKPKQESEREREREKHPCCFFKLQKHVDMTKLPRHRATACPRSQQREKEEALLASSAHAADDENQPTSHQSMRQTVSGRAGGRASERARKRDDG